ncbi:MAG: hypothetical protein ABI637_04070 [Gemmatimonadota bacterium]
MWQPIVWAMLTGGITGAAWVGIVLTQRQRRKLAEGRRLLEKIDDRIAETQLAENRLVEAEERLDFAEHRLMQQRDEQMRGEQMRGEHLPRAPEPNTPDPRP